ncbi:hypothetical protein DIPPA_17248 [Diplonema papillatum]|nr:hypothetical protein DIPPA_17248 [Diplonema papillatum]
MQQNLALAEWCSTKRWSETGKEASISYFELAVDFELHSGLTLTPAGTQRRQENIAQRQPKERWTVTDTLPGEETAAFFDDGSRGNGTNGAVAGAVEAVFYDKSVKQWEVEKPIAGRATNNVAEYVGFVSVLTRLMRDTVPPTPRTIVVKGDSELVIGQIEGTKRCNETLRRYTTTRRRTCWRSCTTDGRRSSRRTFLASSTTMRTNCPTAPWTPHSDRRHRPTATRRPRKGGR